MKIEKLTQLLETKMMTYAAEVNLDRAIVSVNDGLKPVHRKILWKMYEDKCFKFTKSANVAGSVMTLHPHSSTYDTIVRMTQEEANNVNYIIGKGNFAKYTSRDMAPAAERYTEIKLSELAIETFQDIKHMVDFIPNYDNTKMMPKYIPFKYPNILVNASSGIGVGMSSSIASYNLKDVCLNTKKYIETGEKVIWIPDFATGGKILKHDEQFKSITETGKGTITLEAKYEINGNTVNVTEIPYETTSEAIVDKIISLVKANKVLYVTDVKDLTGDTGLNVEITFKRGTDVKLAMLDLLNKTQLRNTYSANMNVLVDGHPKVLGIYSILDEWIKFRCNNIYNLLTYKINKLSEELHLLYGLKTILLDIEKTIQIIRFSDDMIKELKDTFKIDDKQAQFITNISLKNINEKYIIKQINEIETKEVELKQLKNETSEEKLKEKICSELQNIADTYGNDRLTEIIEPTVINNNIIKTLNTKNVNEDVEYRIVITKNGFIHKHKNIDNNIKLLENDKIVFDKLIKNTGEVITLSLNKSAYKILVKKIAETKANEFGHYIPTLLNINKEDFLYSFATDNYEGYMLILYDGNRLNKLSIEHYKTKGNRYELKGSLHGSSNALDAKFIEKDEKITLKTQKAKIKINTENLESTHRGHRGFKIDVKKDNIIEIL